MYTVEHIFATLAPELPFESFVIAAGVACDFVCDREFGGWLRNRGVPDAQVLPIAAADTLTPRPGRELVVCALAGERETLTALSHRLPEESVHGLFADLLPACAARRSLPVRRTDPLRRYVILCTPRSGSYFLCGLLSSCGLASPREHLLTSICDVARDVGHDLLDYLEDLAQVGAIDGWFGTKIISHKLFDAFARGLTPEAFVDHVKARGYRTIYLHREDKVAQAVSNYFARETNVWWRRAGTPPAQPPAYDYARIKESYDFLQQQEQWLAAVASYMPACETVTYERLERDTREVMLALLDHLGADPASLRLAADTERQRDDHSRECAERFAAELSSS